LNDRSKTGQGWKNYLEVKPRYESKFSAVVPVMTGCNNFCSYCVVPYTRGREISRPAEDIVCEIKNLIKRGYKEIWLLGQNINSYKDGKTNFPKLLKKINDIPGKFWIRFTSSHPKDFSDELIEAMARCGKATPYLNLPVQSGDNNVLKRMNRPYTIEQYKKMIEKVRERIPGITISTDIIVGFPGETEKEFQNSVKLFKEIKYDMAYISEYSSRSGTAAAKMEDNVSKPEKAKRKYALNETLKKTASEKNRKYVGKTVEVLVESEKNGSWYGKTKEYKTIKLDFPAGSRQNNENLAGKFLKAFVVASQPWGLSAKIKQ